MLEILSFRQFHRHIIFRLEGNKIRNKELKRCFDVSVVIYGVWEYEIKKVLIIEIDIKFINLISIFYVKIYLI